MSIYNSDARFEVEGVIISKGIPMGVRESSSVCCDCPEHHEERRHKQTPVHSAEITEVQWGKKTPLGSFQERCGFYTFEW